MQVLTSIDASHSRGEIISWSVNVAPVFDSLNDIMNTTPVVRTLSIIYKWINIQHHVHIISNPDAVGRLVSATSI